MVTYRAASVADVAGMAKCRTADRAAGPADERIALYLEGKHHPQQALLPRIAYVATISNEVVGYIAGHLTRRYDCDGELQHLYVVPAQRRAGVAGELLSRLATWFAGLGARRICVNVEPENAGARAFYARHGAQPLSKNWYVWNDILALARGAA